VCPHPHQAGLILLLWWNVRKKVAIAILCVLCGPYFSDTVERVHCACSSYRYNRASTRCTLRYFSDAIDLKYKDLAYLADMVQLGNCACLRLQMYLSKYPVPAYFACTTERVDGARLHYRCSERVHDACLLRRMVEQVHGARLPYRYGERAHGALLLCRYGRGSTRCPLTLQIRPRKYMVPTYNDLFHRLETVHFFRLFTGEGDMENTGRGNTEPRGLKARVLP
jgi:hypothetical protein